MSRTASREYRQPEPQGSLQTIAVLGRRPRKRASAMCCFVWPLAGLRERPGSNPPSAGITAGIVGGLVLVASAILCLGLVVQALGADNPNQAVRDAVQPDQAPQAARVDPVAETTAAYWMTLRQDAADSRQLVAAARHRALHHPPVRRQHPMEEFRHASDRLFPARLRSRQ